MEIDIAKTLIKKYVPGHSSFVLRAIEAERYYRKDNDIRHMKRDDGIDNPMRSADNRLPGNFHKLLVNQKASYMFTAPPIFDLGNDADNNLVKTALGDAYRKKCKSLCIKAANAGIAWLHYWKGVDGSFKYAVIDSKQVIPVWSDELERELVAALRTYSQIDDATGYEYVVYEVWTMAECSSFRYRIDLSVDDLEYYYQFPIFDGIEGLNGTSNVITHDYGEVPFIPFENNEDASRDLDDIKELIDAHDKVRSGFLNDLEDIQEVIFILTNYGGESDDAAAVLREMKNKKVIQVESEGAEDRSGVSTLTIEIPVEARKEMMTVLRKAIFEEGQGIDPDPQNFGNSSGVALGYLYSLLELKAGMTETEFSLPFNRLIRAIMRHYGRTCGPIIQTWTRTSVRNDAELADIAQKSKGVVSDETIVKNHPWVEDPEKEMRLLSEQRKQEGIDWDKIPIEKAGDGDGEK